MPRMGVELHMAEQIVSKSSRISLGCRGNVVQLHYLHRQQPLMCALKYPTDTSYIQSAESSIHRKVR